MTGDTESPIRRRTMNQTVRTPMRNNLNASTMPEVESNDDEAERIIRRSTMSVSGDELNLTEQNANIASAMQLYQENKFTKENVWSIKLIDHFANLVAKHHKSMDNFQVAGTTLEASAKIYCLRVDSLHEDTLRMASNLSRQTARQMGSARNADDDDDMDRPDDQQGNDPNSANTGRKKEKRKKRVSSVITNNPATLNGKLETIPFTDPFFAKLNTIVGDINSSNRLMQHMVGSKNGALQIRMDLPCWDPTPVRPVDVDENENYDGHNVIHVKTFDVDERHALHHNLKGYVISDKPAEDDPDEDAVPAWNQTSVQHERSMNHSGAGVVFDPDAEVEPIDTDNNFMMDYGNNDDDFPQQLEQEDRSAVMGCRGLRREVVVVEDMRPVDASSSTLEYSYRPLDNIAKFWAGPSYWKIRRTTNVTAKTNNSDQVAGNKKKVVRKKKKDEVSVTAEIAFNEIPNAFVKREPGQPLKNITYTRTHLNRAWNSKRLRLPLNKHLEQGLFDKFSSGPQFRPSNQEPIAEPELLVESYNYDNEADQEYCRDVNVETDADTETDFGGSELDHANTSNERMMSPSEILAPVNQTVDFIGTEFVGAPEKVEKLVIQYAKVAKPVNMKQLKLQCWNVLSEISASRAATPISVERQVDAQIEFKEVYERLPRVLTKSMAENMSTGLVFYSVLHLANERGVKLVQRENLDGCLIVKQDDF